MEYRLFPGNPGMELRGIWGNQGTELADAPLRSVNGYENSNFLGISIFGFRILELLDELAGSRPIETPSGAITQ
jgi:hypothetical protein